MENIQHINTPVAISVPVQNDGDYNDRDEHNDPCCFEEKPRSSDEVLAAIEILRKQVWYNRCYLVLCQQIEEGEVKTVGHAEWHALKYPDNQDYIVDDIWVSAQKAAKHVEDELGEENLVPWNDFELGMINGKLSALRWMRGDDWDQLDT